MTGRGFGSDNHAGVHPEVMAAIASANEGHAHGYGDDAWTQAAIEHVRSHFDAECDVAFVFNGTGANCASFATTCRPYHSVVCAETAHVNMDECGAPERVGGVKLVPVPTADGKLTLDLVRPQLTAFGFEHSAQPRLISVSNVSELGTVYTPAELRALADLAHEHGMLLHVDGARIANAAAALDCGIADIADRAGVDVLSLGGTKLGMLFGEAVVLFGDARTNDLKYIRKQSTQLASKMRFVSAQFSAMFGGDLWLRCASRANAMADRLASGARDAGIEITQSVDANEVFARLDPETIGPLQEEYHFYVWDEARHEVRWVTSWDTTEDDVDSLVRALRS